MTAVDECTLPCQRARDAARAAAQALSGSSTLVWNVEFYALPCEPGEIKLTHAGGPSGRVPLEVQGRLWAAVTELAQEQLAQIAAEKTRRMARHRHSQRIRSR